jgi:hypothetical protein
MRTIAPSNNVSDNNASGKREVPASGAIGEIMPRADRGAGHADDQYVPLAFRVSLQPIAAA